MIVKIHKNKEGRSIVAVCDEDILGKKFVEGDLQLDLCSNFYKGEKKSESEILAIIKGVYIVNLVGKKSIELGLKARIIEKENIMNIAGIPHAQALIL